MKELTFKCYIFNCILYLRLDERLIWAHAESSTGTAVAVNFSRRWDVLTKQVQLWKLQGFFHRSISDAYGCNQQSGCRGGDASGVMEVGKNFPSKSLQYPSGRLLCWLRLMLLVLGEAL